MTEYKLKVNGEVWHTNSPQSKYDVIHAVAGAVLSGADEITVEKIECESTSTKNAA